MATVSSSVAAMPRHALGLPAGSVRAILAFGVLALSWALVLTYKKDQLPFVFIYLQGLLVLIMASFFVAHGKSIGRHVSTRSPLGMPRGSVRFVLMVGFAGLIYYLYVNKRSFELPDEKWQAWFVLLQLVGAFFLGHLLSQGVRAISGGTEPFWYQDIQAWLALIAMILMAVVAIVHLVINTTLPLPLEMPTTEAILTAVVGFYFGARS